MHHNVKRLDVKVAQFVGEDLVNKKLNVCKKISAMLPDQCLNLIKDKILFKELPNGSTIVSDQMNLVSIKKFLSKEGHPGCVNALSVDSIKKRVVSGAADKTIKIWDCQNGICLKKLIGHTGIVTSVVANRDTIISGSGDCTVKIWDKNSGQCIKTLNVHNDMVLSVIADQEKIISGTINGSIKLWDPRMQQCIKNFVGHKEAVIALTFNENKKEIISVSIHGTIKKWDIDMQRCIKTFEHMISDFDCIGSVAFNKSVSKVALQVYGPCSNKVIMKDLATGECVKIIDGFFYEDIAFHPVYNELLISAGKTLNIWHIDSGKRIKNFGYLPLQVQATVPTFSSNGDTLFTGDSGGVISKYDFTDYNKKFAHLKSLSLPEHISTYKVFRDDYLKNLMVK